MSQAMEALKLANEVKLRRFELRERLRRGEVRLQDVLEGEVPDWLAGHPVESLVRAVRSVGRGKAKRICLRANVRPTMELGALCERRRSQLARAFEETCPIVAR